MAKTMFVESPILTAVRRGECARKRIWSQPLSSTSRWPEVGFGKIGPHGTQNSQTLSQGVSSGARQAIEVVLTHRLQLEWLLEEWSITVDPTFSDAA